MGKSLFFANSLLSSRTSNTDAELIFRFFVLLLAPKPALPCECVMSCTVRVNIQDILIVFQGSGIEKMEDKSTDVEEIKEKKFRVAS